MFYIYVEDYEAVYEPAEGGYYVQEAYIQDDYETFHRYCYALGEFEDSVKHIRDTQGYHLNKVYICSDGTRYAIFEDYGYIGDGFALCMSTEAPHDRIYEGYR